jgi:1-deoxy-D-xylulose-5-phosphate reductoisomerase
LGRGASALSIWHAPGDSILPRRIPPDSPASRLRSAPLAGNPGLPIVLNAANEIAVSAFLDRRIGLTAIPDLIGRAMEAYEAGGPAAIRDLADVRAVDRWHVSSRKRALYGKIKS